jgi:prephenate dehydrogenase
MSAISIAILGLGRIGASVGLALKRYNTSKEARHEFKITGYDSLGTVRDAPKQGIVDGMARHIADASRNQDMVVLALPYAEVQNAYRSIGSALRPGGVVLDMSPLKTPSIKWADEHLPDETYLVGLAPIINPKYLFDGLDGYEFAQADMFDNGGMLLMPAANCSKEAVELATDFSTLLGAKPHFMDAGEHDSHIAATEGLPTLLGAAYFYMLQSGKGWDDSRRLTNPAFGRLTHQLVESHPDDLRDQLLNNREQLAHYLDSMIDTLQTMRQVLHENNRDALEAALIESAQSYREWFARRERNQWEDDKARVQANASLMSGLMGDFLARKVRGDDKDGR